jgi:hypothetical protein
MNRTAALVVSAASAFLSACHSPTGPSGPALLLPANIVDPMTVNAVSQFNSCVGHAFPQPTSPNSGKNYFWPTSATSNTTDQLRLYAACDGTTSQNTNDTNDPSPVTAGRGLSIHLYCDNSSTGLRYFHVNVTPGLLGQHVRAGDLLGYAVMLGPGQSPAATWQFSSNFDVGVIQGDDSVTVNYFAALSGSALGAWAARGVTSVSQTVYPGNPTCASYSSYIGGPGILPLTPAF